ncbi:hypothetical protein CSKR_112881 [Clonorchis sinensis]|uniref:Uncharacterized protein n=1 Tax=Clonorchis sinensis TaxID=79923 RepID=A0A3R7DA80_CLOSI|nr:hypothetical protein CSKR_112881 [Clonorchis sinensis]
MEVFGACALQLSDDELLLWTGTSSRGASRDVLLEVIGLGCAILRETGFFELAKGTAEAEESQCENVGIILFRMVIPLDVKHRSGGVDEARQGDRDRYYLRSKLGKKKKWDDPKSLTPATKNRKRQCPFVNALNLKARLRTASDGRCLRAIREVAGIQTHNGAL